MKARKRQRHFKGTSSDAHGIGTQRSKQTIACRHSGCDQRGGSDAKNQRRRRGSLGTERNARFGSVGRCNGGKKGKAGRVERQRVCLESRGERMVSGGWYAAARGLQRIGSCRRTAAMRVEIAAEGAMACAGRDEALHQKDEYEQDSKSSHGAIISTCTSLQKRERTGRGCRCALIVPTRRKCLEEEFPAELHHAWIVGAGDLSNFESVKPVSMF